MRHTLILAASIIGFCLAACGDKTTSSASVPVTSSPHTYQASLADGIDFTKDGYPKFIVAVSGMSGHEPWGRWTDANAGGSVARFTFKDKLPPNFTLSVTASAYGPNEGQPIKVRAGSINRSFTIKNGEKPSTYAISFDEVDGNNLEFTPPAPTSPKSLGFSEDPREIGVGFVNIKIQ
jgi:phosphoglycerol transferase